MLTAAILSWLLVSFCAAGSARNLRFRRYGSAAYFALLAITFPLLLIALAVAR